MLWAILPFVSGVAWIGTILGLLIPWLVQGRPVLPSFDRGQHIAFISDLGAFNLKPVFIAGASVTIAFYIFTLFAERSLRHRIAPGRPSCGEMSLTTVVFVGAGLGGAALILLSIFDNFHFKSTHDKLVGVFIVGNLVSAFFLVVEYLGVVRKFSLSPRDKKLARTGFYMKLVYLFLQLIAAVGFVAAQTVDKNPNHEDLAAVLEYVNSFLFAWFIFSFIFDLRKHPSRGYDELADKHHPEKTSDKAPLIPTTPQLYGARYEHAGL